jgi:hypothetical protein
MRVTTVLLAEEEGFEPSVGSPLRLISSQVHSTTLPPLRICFDLSKQVFYQVLGSDLGQATHIGPQNFRHRHTAVGILVVFQHRHQRPAYRQA